MKTLIFGLIASLLSSSLISTAQVDKIKSESLRSTKKSSPSSTSSSGSSESVSGNLTFEIIKITLLSAVAWQGHKLEKKTNPALVSLDVMVEVAVQPSNYYIILPRIRGNWGLFSTDFRYNYLIEENIDGPKYIGTSDWQILELNIITSKNIIGRIGGGVLQENFSGGKTFPEWTAGFNLLANNQKIGGLAEYRWSEPRTEVSAQLQYKLFDSKSLHMYATAGVVYQKYYDKIDLWGMQGGLMMRVF